MVSITRKVAVKFFLKAVTACFKVPFTEVLKTAYDRHLYPPMQITHLKQRCIEIFPHHFPLHGKLAVIKKGLTVLKLNPLYSMSAVPFLDTLFFLKADRRLI